MHIPSSGTGIEAASAGTLFRVLLVIVCLSLHACASVPLSTALRLSAFDARDFAQLQADEVALKLRVPQGFEVDVAHSWLGIDITSTAGERETRFELEQVQFRTVDLPGGLLSRAKPGVEYEVRLSEPSRQQFRELQEFLARGKTQDIGIRAVPKLARAPSGATSVLVWIDLRLSREEGYFALVDGSTLALHPR